jgi:hypothetical protein
MKCTFFILFFFFPALLVAQPSIQWSKCYGGTKNDFPGGMIQTPDGGYIMTAETKSSDKDITFTHGDYDLWVVKLTANGNIQWQKTYGGSKEDGGGAILPAIGGGYIIAAATSSDDGDVTGLHGQTDIWVIRIDSIGNLLWQKTFGGSNIDYPSAMLDAGEGEYVIMGQTNSNDGDVKGLHGKAGRDSSNIWLLKISESGTILWQHTFGGSHDDLGFSLIPTREGGYAIVGRTNSIDGDVTGRVRDTSYDLWLLKLNSSGDIQWQKTYGGSGFDQGNAITETLDHGYAIAGETSSNDGDVSGLHGSSYYEDVWILKMDDTGKVLWSKCYGGSQGDYAYSIYQTVDSSYVLGASTASNDGDVTGQHGNSDCWIFKTSESGKLLWQRTLGGTWADGSLGAGIMPAADSGFLVVTVTESVNGDVSGRKGDTTDWDIWLVHLFPEKAGVTYPTPANENIPLYPNPTSGKTTITYTLNKPSEIKIEFYNSLGEKLRTLLDATEETGSYEQQFDLSALPSGSYFFKIEVSGKIEMRAIELLK